MAGAPGGPSGGPERRPGGPCPGRVLAGASVGGLSGPGQLFLVPLPAVAGRGRRRTGHRSAGGSALRGPSDRRPPPERTQPGSAPTTPLPGPLLWRRGGGRAFLESLLGARQRWGAASRGARRWGARASSAGQPGGSTRPRPPDSAAAPGGQGTLSPLRAALLQLQPPIPAPALLSVGLCLPGRRRLHPRKRPSLGGDFRGPGGGSWAPSAEGSAGQRTN